MRTKLTTKYLDALSTEPCQRVEVFDTLTPGLGVRVGERTKTWIVFYRVRGKLRRQTIGRYPAVSLASAREQAATAIKAADVGVDLAAQQAAAAEAAARDTFGALAELFLERHAKKRKRTWTEDQRILNRDLLPVWRDTPVRALTRRAIREHIDAIADRAPTMANRVLALTSTILNFGLDREWLDANPAARLRKPGQETARERVLTDAEIRQLWQALAAAETAYRALDGRVTVARLGDDVPLVRPMLADWLRLRLLTAQRGGEVIRMQWRELSKVDGRRVWTIPADVAKNGRAHAVPLSPAAVAILARRRRDVARGVSWVFPNELDRGPAKDRAKKVALSAFLPGASDVRGHDLRRTAASGLARLGVARETIAFVLNHVDRGPRATAVYDRFDRLPEKRAALDRWAREVERIITGAALPKVVALAR